MTTWAEFAAAAPELSAEGRRLLYRGESGEALLATVRDDEPPRIHPISVAIIDDRLYAFINRSPKRRDLATDGRYALHAHQDPAVPREFTIRGRATLVEADDVRSAVASRWTFEPDETYSLFEFSIDSALLGVRDTPDEWPPRYTSWPTDEFHRSPRS
jgi:pyridoxamine 5'-phosphate oxidase-like protein